MSSSTKGLLGTLLAIVLIVGAGTALYALCDTDNATTWYVQVDNEHATARDHNEFGYQLEAYNEGGEHRSISFGTERLLRDQAFLKLSVMPLRGVVAWEEVQLEDIPQATRAVARFNEP